MSIEELSKTVQEQGAAIKSLQTMIEKMQAAPKTMHPKGWIRASEMRKMLGSTDKDGNFLRPMSYVGFKHFIEQNHGEYEVRKIGKVYWVTKYPGMDRAA